MRKRYKVISTGPVRRLFKDFRLPMVASLIFAVTLLAMLLLRYQEAVVISEVLSSTSGQDYGALLNDDKTDDLSRPNTLTSDRPEPSAGFAEPDQNQPENETFTVSSGNSSSSPPPTPPASPTPSAGGTSPPPPSSTPPPAQPPPALPFAASIDYLRADGSTKSCDATVSGQPLQCFKRYRFQAGVKTFHGPGSVAYSWQSNSQGANDNGSFSVGPGDGVTTLDKTITVPCQTNQQFVSLQLFLNSPNQDASHKITIPHNCDTTLL